MLFCHDLGLDDRNVGSKSGFRRRGEGVARSGCNSGGLGFGLLPFAVPPGGHLWGLEIGA
jgi:hypothetical protein